MYIGDWLGKREQLTPDRLALIDAAENKRYTYRELNRRANRLANYLRRELRLAKGERAAILAMNCIQHLDLFFALGKIGGIFVPLNYRLAASELARILGDSRPRVLIYGQEFKETVEALGETCDIEHRVAIGQGLPCSSRYEEIMAGSPDVPPEETELGLDDPYAILYTGGTTGLSKGVVLSHGMILWNSVNTILRDLAPRDVSLAHAPLFHTGGLNVYTVPLFHLGGTVVLMRAWDVEQAIDLIERERITVMFAVPTQWRMMLESPRFQSADFSSVRFFVTGGAPCPLSIIEAFRRKGVILKQGYGLTEVGPGCFALDPEDAFRKAGSIGRPNFHIDARIVDESGREVGVNRIGELILRGPSVCSGYWNDPQATAEAMRDGWFYTGDLARVDEEGCFYIVGRKKDMFISGGENVYPAEVENILNSHPQVVEAAVIGVPDEKWGEVGMAFVVPRPGEKLNCDELVEFCRGKLAKYKVPRYFEIVDELPKNQAGKVVKSALRERFVR